MTSWIRPGCESSTLGSSKPDLALRFPRSKDWGDKGGNIGMPEPEKPDLEERVARLERDPKE